jgi:hypothetical protein
MKKSPLQLSLLALFALLINSSFSQEYHVETTGNDNANGSAATPWQTIQHAMDNVSAGSTVYVHEGIYFERLYVVSSGEEGAYVAFQNFENDEVIIDGNGTTDPALVEIHNVHHIILDGFILRNNFQLDAMGVLVEGACDHITLRNLELYDIGFTDEPSPQVNSGTNAQPIIVYGSDSNHTITDLKIIDCELHHCVLGFSEALAVNGNVEGFEISGNEIYTMTNIGIDIIGHEGTCEDPALDQARQGLVSNNNVRFCTSSYAAAAGIYVDGGSQILIERNEIYGCEWGIEIGCENVGKSASEIIVRNNFIYSSLDAGIAVGGYFYPNGSGKVTDVIIAHNTLYNNGLFSPFNGEMYLTYIENGQITENIIFIDNGSAVAVGTDGPEAQNLLFDNNLIYTEQGENNTSFIWYTNDYQGITAFANGTGNCSNCLTEDPLLVFEGLEPDLHLEPGSPAIDQGVISTYMGEQDIDGEQRVFGFGPDYGADEFGSEVGTNDLSGTPSFSVYPNPTTDFITLEFSLALSMELTISDAQGKIVLTTSNVRSMQQFDLHDLDAGVYLVTLREESSAWSSQFIKE